MNTAHHWATEIVNMKSLSNYLPKDAVSDDGLSAAVDDKHVVLLIYYFMHSERPWLVASWPILTVVLHVSSTHM